MGKKIYLPSSTHDDAIKISQVQIVAWPSIIMNNEMGAAKMLATIINAPTISSSSIKMNRGINGSMSTQITMIRIGNPTVASLTVTR